MCSSLLTKWWGVSDRSIRFRFVFHFSITNMFTIAIVRPQPFLLDDQNCSQWSYGLPVIGVLILVINWILKYESNYKAMRTKWAERRKSKIENKTKLEKLGYLIKLKMDAWSNEPKRAACYFVIMNIFCANLNCQTDFSWNFRVNSF